MDLSILNQVFDLSTFRYASLFEGITFPWEALERLKEFLKKLPLGEIKGKINSGVFLENPELISIGEETVVESGAYIRGPCIIGRNCQVRHGAYIRGHVLVGDTCVIGHSTEVKHSIFLNRAKAGHFSYVGDSILGNGVNLGAGTKCANLRFDGAKIIVHFNQTKIQTGLKKLGAIFGDESQTGCNSVTNPGAILEKGGVIYPCSNEKSPR
ncbi:MAG: UDP-N-acetylglucosamine diphosphorylase [Chlamydiia bacterium]|nr:UDP-N-acetylglucosamine diphosphorylase [Chlamydiia bacterium]